MIRNVLEDYFSSIKDERDFDFPLMSLLSAMGYYDIHFTHGDREIGKDFIAKKIEKGVEYQYAFQSKKGDINQSKCTNEVFPQLLLASISGLSHPQFNKSLPRRVILVSTGRLVGNAGFILLDFNEKLKNDYSQEGVVFWGPNQLIPLFEEHGLSSIHQLTAQGLAGFTQFYLIYSKVLDGKVSDREIEEFSRLWLDDKLDYQKRILRASIETEILAVKLVGSGQVYEAITMYLGLARTVMHAMYESEDSFLADFYRQIIDENILPLCNVFCDEIKTRWEGAQKDLLGLVGGQARTLPMLHYIVWCARVLEIGSLYFFLVKDVEKKNEISAFVSEFSESEIGCGHTPGERYSVALVWTALMLVQTNPAAAKELLKRNLIWLCDRSEGAFGLPHYDADEYQETAKLVGYGFDSIKVEKDSSSFVATILADLAAFIDNEFYALVVNDISACELAYTYWQFPDTKAIFTVYSKDSRTYPNSVHKPSLTHWGNFDYAEHMKDEVDSFRLTDKTGVEGLVLLSVFLKDRYFPKMWKQIVAN